MVGTGFELEILFLIGKSSCFLVSSLLYFIYWKILALKCTEIHHTGFEPLINKMSVINKGIENELVGKKLRIIFRDFKLNL